MKKMFLVVALVLSALLALISCSKPAPTAAPAPTATPKATSAPAPAAKPLTMKVSLAYQPTNIQAVVARKFKEVAEKATEGRLLFDIYESSSLYNTDQEMMAVSTGAVDMIARNTAYIANTVPSWGIVDLPFLFTNADAVTEAIEKTDLGRQKLIKPLEDQFKLKYGFQAIISGRYAFTKVRPLRTVEDFKGIKFRVADAKMIEVSQLLGASGLTVSIEELYAMLQQGTVTGHWGTVDSVVTRSFGEIEKYLCKTPVGLSGGAFVYSRGFWDKVPADIQQTLESKVYPEVIGWTHKYYLENDKKRFDEAVTKFKDQVTELDPSEIAKFVAAMAPIYAKEEPKIGKDVIDMAKQVNAKYVK